MEMTTKNELEVKTKPSAKRNREKTRQRILDVAFKEFAENGLSGGNTDEIAAKAEVTKRLIFYYFNSKEELFTAVLEQAYARMRDEEEKLGLDVLQPKAALRALVNFTFDFDDSHEDFVRLVLTENIHRGSHMAHSLKLKEMTQPIIEQITRLLARGVAVGVFRRGIDPVELHMTLSALCFFHQGNRHTFGRQFDYDMSSPAAKVKRKKQIFELMWRYVRAED
jgi:AcrR family transcriptional regulator